MTAEHRGRGQTIRRFSVTSLSSAAQLAVVIRSTVAMVTGVMFFGIGVSVTIFPGTLLMPSNTLLFRMAVGSLWIASLASACQAHQSDRSAQSSPNDPQPRANDEHESSRKVVYREAPSYPELARRMRIKGLVKIEAVVANNGVVKSVAIKGGHPVLAQAAAHAVSKWKWAPSSHETKEELEVSFEPDQR